MTDSKSSQLFFSIHFQLLSRFIYLEIGQPRESDNTRCPASLAELEICLSVSIALPSTLYSDRRQVLTAHFLEAPAGHSDQLLDFFFVQKRVN